MRRKRGGLWRGGGWDSRTAPAPPDFRRALIDLSAQRHQKANRLGAGPDRLDRGNPDARRCHAFVPAVDVKVLPILALRALLDELQPTSQHKSDARRGARRKDRKQRKGVLDPILNTAPVRNWSCHRRTAKRCLTARCPDCPRRAPGGRTSVLRGTIALCAATWPPKPPIRRQLGMKAGVVSGASISVWQNGHRPPTRLRSARHWRTA
jgi:hypothetical protein